jgi:predicted DNA-binding transcriptional regulator AlpA
MEESLTSNISILWRPPKAAEYVGLTVSTLAKKRPTGDGPKFIRLSPRAIGYIQSDLDDWITDRRCGSTSEYGLIANSAPVK